MWSVDHFQNWIYGISGAVGPMDPYWDIVVPTLRPWDPQCDQWIIPQGQKTITGSSVSTMRSVDLKWDHWLHIGIRGSILGPLDPLDQCDQLGASCLVKTFLQTPANQNTPGCN